MVRAARAIIAGALVFTGASAPAGALAEDWVYEPEGSAARAASTLRFSTRFNVWISTFDRPERACDPDANDADVPVAIRTRGLRPAQVAPPSLQFCPSAGSDELGVGAGVEVAFRVFGPLHLSAGADLIYTAPELDVLLEQLIIAVPFGLLVTPYDWDLRPIVRLTIMPVLYLTDDARDYTIGGDLGFAWSVLDLGDLSFTLGHHASDTVEGTELHVAFHPLW